jgi:hypothetical protein
MYGSTLVEEFHLWLLGWHKDKFLHMLIHQIFIILLNAKTPIMGSTQILFWLNNT